MKAPVTYVPDYLTRVIGVTFTELWEHLTWEQREGAPRREFWSNHYDLAYTYGSGDHARTYAAQPYHPIVKAIELTINSALDLSFDCCFINGYATGREHLGWHADDSPEMDNEHPIAVVSVGAPREIWFRELKGLRVFGETESQMLGNGSFLLMHAGMQRTWQHRIPKSSVAGIGPRLSLTFRKLVR
jgi:alkylated DNA repair dioxygenase AlkB